MYFQLHMCMYVCAHTRVHVQYQVLTDPLSPCGPGGPGTVGPCWAAVARPGGPGAPGFPSGPSKPCKFVLINLFLIVLLLTAAVNC